MDLCVDFVSCREKFAGMPVVLKKSDDAGAKETEKRYAFSYEHMFLFVFFSVYHRMLNFSIINQKMGRFFSVLSIDVNRIY